MKGERKQNGKKILVRFRTVRSLKKREFMEFLENADIKYESIQEQSNVFLVKFEDEREAQHAIN